MKNSDEEYYVFLKYCEKDFRAALKSYAFVSEQEFGYHQLVYLRDAVVSYGRPFSGNRGVYERRLRLEKEIVPVEFRGLHEYIIWLRDTLFAHSDIQARNPELLVLGHNEDEVFVNDKETIYLSDVKEKLNNMEILIKEAQEALRIKIDRSFKNL